MHSCLLKKLLPFALTFIVGSFIGGLFGSHAGPATWSWADRSTLTLGHGGPFSYEYYRSCRMHRRDLVAETKPLAILFKPDARFPRTQKLPKESFTPANVLVTFGADGRVQKVESIGEWLVGRDVWQAVERAAWQIQFTPETVNGMPVTVTKEVEINFMDDGRQ